MTQKPILTVECKKCGHGIHDHKVIHHKFFENDSRYICQSYDRCGCFFDVLGFNTIGDYWRLKIRYYWKFLG